MIMTYIVSIATFTKASLLVIELKEVGFFMPPPARKQNEISLQSRIKCLQK